MGAAVNNNVNFSANRIRSAETPFNGIGQSLKPGSVVWCAFPFHTAPRRPGAYPRPCLVLEERCIGNSIHYLVAYGTTKNLDKQHCWPGDIVIGPEDGIHFEETGLDGPGKFRLCQTALLPATPSFFPCPTFDHTRVAHRLVDGVCIGKFTPALINVLQHAFKVMKKYQKIQAHHGYETVEPTGPMANLNHLATGQNQLRRKP